MSSDSIRAQPRVIHRDLKPQNMIVGDYGETIVLDWGLASVIDAPYKPTESILLQDDPEVLTAAESLKTLSGAIMGTPAYMPPEQATVNWPRSLVEATSIP
ncbi:MAG: phosphotransferase [Pirellulaceae bacterium]